MLLTKTVNMTVTYVNKKYFTDLNYDTSLKYITVNIKDLSMNSHKLVEVKCDVCGATKMLPYNKYNKNTKHGNVYYSCSILCSTTKKREFFLNKYGVINPSMLTEIKEKQKKTNIDKYGTISALQNKEVRIKSVTSIRERYHKNYQIELSIEPFRIYRNEVNIETRKNKKTLFDSWNFLDYYDNENIKDNMKLRWTNRNYPTIDHKISILYGFNNNIDAKVIGSIDNLCITKRWINSSKSSKLAYKKK